MELHTIILVRIRLSPYSEHFSTLPEVESKTCRKIMKDRERRQRNRLQGQQHTELALAANSDDAARMRQIRASKCEASHDS